MERLTMRYVSLGAGALSVLIYAANYYADPVAVFDEHDIGEVGIVASSSAAAVDQIFVQNTTIDGPAYAVTEPEDPRSGQST